MSELVPMTNPPRPAPPAPTDPADFEVEDEELIAQLIRRVQRSRGRQLNRRAAGLPATTLAGENEMVRQYTARLGRPGRDIALAILALARQRQGPARDGGS
ncbi:hypothetical protein ACF073_28805 [Streptomyces sp. NPDC015171]|uniref:hypothetical protein n=1 Tax=Streptomyces sp. NPDC015171 TaxID=3364945 RepID=UPI0036FC1B03